MNEVNAINVVLEKVGDQTGTGGSYGSSGEQWWR